MNQNTYSNPYLGGSQPPIQNFPNYQGQNQNPIGQPQYAENLLQLNRGKMAKFYMSYSDSIEWRDRIFEGIIEDAGRDYTLLRDPKDNHSTILWNVYLNFVEFEEPINH